MSQFIESIKVEDQEMFLLEFHQKRVNDTFAHFGKEGSIDLARLAGLKPAGVLCEVTNPDGTMASGIQVLAYAQTHHLTLITIEELVQYRLAQHA